MTPPADDYCELCDLPLSTCVHGNPPAPPAEKKAPRSSTPTTPRTPRTPRPRASSPGRSAEPAVSVRSAPARRTPQGQFRPVILALLQEGCGRMEAEKLLGELEQRMTLKETDYETVNRGEPRWRYAARLERKAMLDDGLMAAPREPGVWELTAEGMRA